MPERRIIFIMASAVIVLLPVSAVFSAPPSARPRPSAGGTWQLGQDQEWKALSAEGEDKYLLAVAEIKQLVSTGQTEAVREALEQLKKEFPEVAGQDLDAFIKAEILFSEGKFSRAVRGYDKFLDGFPESALFEAALDRQFSIATAFLAGQMKAVLGIFRLKGYAEGKRIMERITDRVGLASPIGLRAAIAIAESFEKRERFEDAFRKWQEISSQWSTGQIGPSSLRYAEAGRDTLLAMARCKHAAYRGPKYDGSNLISAKSYYEKFREQYPEDARQLDVDGKLKQIEQQQSYKQLGIGEYYQRTGNKQSANLYYQMVMDNWPGSSAAEVAKEMLNWNLGSKEQENEK